MRKQGRFGPFALDRTNFPELRDRIFWFRPEDTAQVLPRTYPGYPKLALPAGLRPRLWPRLDTILARRRCFRELDGLVPPRSAVGHILRFSHGVNASEYRGPTPSAGGLQALELYVVVFEESRCDNPPDCRAAIRRIAAPWAEPGVYHYDRAGHHLSRIVQGAVRACFDAMSPSLAVVKGGALLWVLAGDYERVAAKYGERGFHFLVLEAGHLMQNLCLTSESLGLATVPLGGYFEDEVADALALPPGDVVLYLGLCGKPINS